MIRREGGGCGGGVVGEQKDELLVLVPSSENSLLKEGVHGSAQVYVSKYFFAFARYDPSLFNLIRCL